MIYKMTDDKKEIMIEHMAEKNATFDDFKAKLPEKECRFAVLDVEVETSSGQKNNKIVFITWSDDNAPLKTKFLYASSKDNFKQALKGSKEYAAHSVADLDLVEIREK